MLQVLGMISHQNYLYRMTVLSAIVALAPNVPHDVLSTAMLPVTVTCSKVRSDFDGLALRHRGAAMVV